MKTNTKIVFAVSLKLVFAITLFFSSAAAFAQESTHLLDSLTHLYKKETSIPVYEFTEIDKVKVEGEIKEYTNYPVGSEVTMISKVVSIFSVSDIAFSENDVWQSYLSFLNDMDQYPEHIRTSTISSPYFQEFYRACTILGFTDLPPAFGYPTIDFVLGWDNKYKVGVSSKIRIHHVKNKRFLKNK